MGPPKIQNRAYDFTCQHLTTTKKVYVHFDCFHGTCVLVLLSTLSVRVLYTSNICCLAHVLRQKKNRLRQYGCVAFFLFFKIT